LFRGDVWFALLLLRLVMGLVPEYVLKHTILELLVVNF
jgi:hypothetical protein